MKPLEQSQTDNPQPEPAAVVLPPSDSSGVKKRRLLTFKRGSKIAGGDTAKKAPAKRFSYVKFGIIILVLAVLAGGGYAGYKAYKQYTLPASVKASNETTKLNEALQKNDRAQALADAKKALSYTPNDVNAILAVAYLTKAENPGEAKQYFAQAFNEFKKQNNPDVSGKSAETYWAAAGLAEQAGETDQAKQYYQKVIEAANPSDSYEQSLATQSQAALKRLSS